MRRFEVKAKYRTILHPCEGAEKAVTNCSLMRRTIGLTRNRQLGIEASDSRFLVTEQTFLMPQGPSTRKIDDRRGLPSEDSLIIGAVSRMNPVCQNQCPEGPLAHLCLGV